MSKSPAPKSPPGSPWMPVTAGTLSIITGAIQALFGLFIIGAAAELAERSGLEGRGIAGVMFLILGLVAIVGGVFAALRRAWLMALIGAIAGAVWPLVSLFRTAFRPGAVVLLLILLICGLSAVVLTVVGRPDFKK